MGFNGDTAILLRERDVFHVRAITVQPSPQLHTFYAAIFSIIL